MVARLIALGLTPNLGQQVIVENRGGSAVIPAQIVAHASPDGYTLLLFGSTIWLLPLLESVPYDPARDFAPITLAVSSPNIVVVYPSLPVQSIKDLIGLAKEKPGSLNYASGITGSANHLAAELFQSLAGVRMVRIAYKGAAPAVNAVVGGQVHLMFASAGSVSPHIKSGRLRALAVTSARPSALFAGLPTVADAGLPGYDSVLPTGVFAPKRTPLNIIAHLNRAIVQVLNTQETRERMLNAGAEVVASSPAQFADAMTSEIGRVDKVIKEAGLRSH